MAMYSSGEVRRFSPEGKLLRTVTVSRLRPGCVRAKFSCLPAGRSYLLVAKPPVLQLGRGTSWVRSRRGHTPVFPCGGAPTLLSRQLCSELASSCMWDFSCVVAPSRHPCSFAAAKFVSHWGFVGTECVVSRFIVSCPCGKLDLTCLVRGSASEI